MANTFLNKDGLSHLVSKLKDYIASQISAHTSNKSNPHGVTKSQVGLGSVANIDQSKAIKSITRSGTTFTATALDGTQTTFDQQDSNTTYGVATASSNGLMSATDKSKLDGIPSDALSKQGGTLSGPIESSSEISDMYGKMVTSKGFDECENVTALLNKVRFTNGSCGSVYFLKAETLLGATVINTWYNYIWVPHRSGAKIGAEDGDNQNFGTLYLTSMVDNGQSAIIRYAGAVSQIRLLDSITKSFTLSASGWSSGAYTISDSLITASSNQEILPATTITAAQYNALSKAQIIDGGQSAGSLTLKALGTVPTIDIPIRVIFRGTI